jgi:hypothetical protein
MDSSANLVDRLRARPRHQFWRGLGRLAVALCVVGTLVVAWSATRGDAVLADETATPRAASTPVAVDEQTLASLTIFAFPPGQEPDAPVLVDGAVAGIGLQPGNTTVLALGTIDYESCGPLGFACFTPVPVSARWSLSADTGGHIDPTSGRLTIDPAAPAGVTFTARAAVADGRRTIERQIYIWTPEANPLIGFWREAAQLNCDTADETAPEHPVQELAFMPDGTFTVTWMPFESYRDYWGAYTFDLEAGTLELVVTGGNTIPDDVDGAGAFAFDPNGRLILREIWLGTPTGGVAPAACGHIFVP